MAVLPILTWPDPMLCRVCAPVLEITPEVRQLAQDMLDTMYDAPGRGLAAPQVGALTRVFVMDATWKDGDPSPITMVNPVIQSTSVARVAGLEGCLSIPGITADVVRSREVDMEWIGLDGEACRQRLTGFAAICAQHELDHLNGLVVFDRLAPDARAALEAKFAAL